MGKHSNYSVKPDHNTDLISDDDNGDDGDDPRMVYSYGSVISGFAARLTETELKAMEAKDGFIQAYPDQTFTVQTTHSASFLGLNRDPGNFWNESGFGSGTIVGVLDSGILPSHPSFSGQGMPPPPSKWKGTCDLDASQCNNKLIGARVFLKGAMALVNETVSGPITPIDRIGHGTHTSSTAAGRFVGNASVLGNALGTASGMAPMAHVAMYRVCVAERCTESNILAGMDAAIDDGVDVLSISLGGGLLRFFESGIAVGSFAAIEKGIFVSCCAGNAGPKESLITNDAPWIMTVGASTTDRSIRTTLKLGNGEEFDGKSLFQSLLPMSPVVYPGTLNPNSAFCRSTSFRNIDVKGKIVVCDLGGNISSIEKGINVKNAGGVGMILANVAAKGFSIFAEAHKLPMVHVTFSDASKIKAYVNETSTNATGMIIPRGTVLGGEPTAPMVACFSSRGPSLTSKGIPKPDILGTGVDVLAAWPLLPVGSSNAASLFNMKSGTSVSAPHISGIAALLKSLHPDWSPAMIKSAIMTTADTTSAVGEPIPDYTLKSASVFARGAGNVNPTKANNPGLVYDIEPEDYIGYMCGLLYTDQQVSLVARRDVSCSSARIISDTELNYPSFWVVLGPSNNFTRTVVRTVTNVGEPNTIYTVMIAAPAGTVVTVTPQVLDFTKVVGKSVATYSVHFAKSSQGREGEQHSEGAITWLSSDKSIAVKSPVVITFQ